VCFNISVNRLTGKLLLNELPRTLKILDLSGNFFEKTAYYGVLTVGIERIFLKESIVRSVQPITKDLDVKHEVIRLS